MVPGSFSPLEHQLPQLKLWHKHFKITELPSSLETKRPMEREPSSTKPSLIKMPKPFTRSPLVNITQSQAARLKSKELRQTSSYQPFSSYNIGERFLEFPLQNDQVAPAYIDPLSDIDYKNRSWFQKNYLPTLHKPQEKWHKVLPQLKANSAMRIENDKNFSKFVTAQKKLKGSPSRSFRRIASPPWGNDDLQMNEAINIMKDMVDLSEKSKTP